MTLTMSFTCALFAGAVSETVGGVVSPGDPLSALNATTCITQALPFCVAPALYDPADETTRSCVIFAANVERVV